MRTQVAAFTAFFFLCAVAGAQTSQPSAPRLKLWENAPGFIPGGNDTDVNPTAPTIDVYLPATGSGPTAAIVILPGGGYVNLSTTREGSDVGKMVASKGIAGFVVRYRHAPRYKFPVPLWDAQRAIRTVRAKAEQYHVDPTRIGILGFSAGGHLAAMVATGIDPGALPATDAIDSKDAAVNFAVLMYPVMTFDQENFVHKGSRTALTGGDNSLFAKLSPDEHVSASTPPTFLAQGSADRTVAPMNSILFYQACLANKIPAELHMFTGGGHGFGLAPTDPAISIWPELMVNWMKKIKMDK